MNKKDECSSHTINGINVIFPMKPYPTQLSVMSHVISALNKSKNCLIESPTGTGKTFALLCSTLGWLHDYKSKRSHANSDPDDNDAIKMAEATDDDFQDSIPKIISVVKEVENNKLERCVIYYCTRTHKQISQVVSELNRTVYGRGQFKMSILSSRKISCVNTTALKSESISDQCRKLISKSTPFKLKCSYFLKSSEFVNHRKIQRLGLPPVYNLEDITNLGKCNNFCPYFTSQKLSESADIIFAPYNYVLSPIISDQMSLNFKNSIIILDEAHNIEDVCRSAMSGSFPLTLLQICINEYTGIARMTVESNNNPVLLCFQELILFLTAFQLWIKNLELQIDFKKTLSQELILDGPDAKTSFITHSKLDKEYLNNVIKNSKKIDNYFRQDEDDNLEKPSDMSQQLLSNIMMCVQFAFLNNSEEFVLSITKGTDEELSKSTEMFSQVTQTMKKHSKTDDIIFNFICLSPALSFKYVTNDCRSIVLASGTLSPLASFAPELGSPFDVSFKTSNYLEEDQACVLAIGVGKSGNPLRLTYQYLNDVKVQDDVGLTVLDICHIAPAGVLCFFPSFSTMEKFTKRWTNTGLMDEIEKIKQIFIESKGMSANDVDILVEDYFASVPDTNRSRGSILFAVCRGRMSEGIDFRDNRARAVITIGIPYSNLKVTEIDKKINYNNNQKEKYKNSSYLSGREWYNIQAFRALNQALGRCIRHKNDWGAIIMIDDRFSPLEPNYKFRSYLSGWISKNMFYKKNHKEFIKSLKEYYSTKISTQTHSYFDENISPNTVSKSFKSASKTHSTRNGLKQYFLSNGTSEDNLD